MVAAMTDVQARRMADGMGRILRYTAAAEERLPEARILTLPVQSGTHDERLDRRWCTRRATHALVTLEAPRHRRIDVRDRRRLGRRRDRDRRLAEPRLLRTIGPAGPRSVHALPVPGHRPRL